MPISPQSSPILLSHAVMGGLTPLIPLPLVDDLFYGYFLRSMAKKLADSHQKTLSSDEIKVLTAQKRRGCALGCLGTVLLYPLKKILRKIFFILEWKRAADTIGRTYYFGFLLHEALQAGWVEKHSATRVRTAMDAVLARTNTSFVSRAALGVMNGSKGSIQSWAARLLGSTPRGAGEREVAQAAQNAGDNDLSAIFSQLQAAINGLPSEHFENLTRELQRELELPPLNPI
ncbi:MAG TPA: hypothetical protein VGB45_04100 [Abditibacterium sp.]